MFQTFAPPRRRRAAALTATIALIASGCGGGSSRIDDPSVGPTPPAASGAPAAPNAEEGARAVAAPASAAVEPRHESMEALATALLAALADRDPAALDRLRVGREEYIEKLFPAFPVARRPGNTTPAELHWKLLDAQSRSGIADAVADYGGLRFTLIGIRASAGIEDYDGFRLHRKVLIRVRVPDGREDDLAILGSIVERDGGFKALSFSD